MAAPVAPEVNLVDVPKEQCDRRARVTTGSAAEGKTGGKMEDHWKSADVTDRY